MLFLYKYVPHKMEKMQEFIDFIFFEVWCKAPGNSSFQLELFNGNPELKELMEAFFYSDTEIADFFYGYVESIFISFMELTKPQISQLKLWYKGNNDIEKVCTNDPKVQIARYSDIEKIDPVLSKKFASFFKELFSQRLLEFKALSEKIGHIDKHYDEFKAVNRGKCTFCGISDMLGVYHTKREAYDHYLPKALYPFNSINFKNLVPACHHCNSTYKNSKDPAYTPKDPMGNIYRRKAFFPFATEGHSIEILIDFSKPDVENLVPADINFIFGPEDIREEINTWIDVYGIVERYRAKLLDEDAKAWLVEILDEWRWNTESGGTEGKAPDEYLRDINRHTMKSPYTNNYFLKKAFLDGVLQSWNIQ